MRKFLSLPLTLVALAACADGPTNASSTDVTSDADAIVLTAGAAAPSALAPTTPRLSAIDQASASAGGSKVSTVHLSASTCSGVAQSGSSQALTLTYSITGNQNNPASFDVNRTWTFDGTSFTGSNPVTISVPAREGRDAPTVRTASITLTNASAVQSGQVVMSIRATNLQTSGTAKLSLASSDVLLTVVFDACPTTTPPNTDPVLVLPSQDFVVEATSATGATVDYSSAVTASDAEDGDLTGAIVCTPASQSVFALGSTTVTCSVSDSKGASASGTFTVKVIDTTPADFTAFPTSPVKLVAADINGATLDVDGLGIAVADWNNVSEPSTFSCDYVPGTKLGIGTTTSVTCKARDAVGNEQPVGKSFQVFVGLNVNATGFLTPLRMVAPYSGHKLGSTIPHKFLAPTYADGTPAIDLADGITLTIRKLDPTPDAVGTDATEFTAGSTTWRYDPLAGQYVFNAKTGTTSPWAPGTWQTVASYKGIELARTNLEIRK